VGARARTSFPSDGSGGGGGGWRGRDNGGGYSDGAYGVSIAPQARANPRAEWSVTNGRFPQTGAATTSGLDALFAD
jgi:hypothetical protein